MRSLANTSKGEGTKINVEAVKENSQWIEEYKIVDSVKILHAILLRQLPPELINGPISLIFALRPNATSEEIESALVLCSVLGIS